MGPVSAEIEIDAPREQVFAALLDLGVRAGSRFCVKGPMRKVWMDTTIVSTDPPFRIVEEGEAGRGNRIRSHIAWELTDAPGALTCVRVSHWTEPAGVDRALELLSGGSIWL